MEELIGDLLHFFFGHPFDAFHHLIYSEEPVEEKRLPRQVRHTAAGRFQAQRERTLQVILGPAQFLVRYRFVLQIAEFGQCQIHHFPYILNRRSPVHRQAPGIAIKIQFGEDRVSQPLLLPHVLEQARTHPATQNRAQYIARISFLMRNRVCRHAHTDVHLFQRSLALQNQRSLRNRRRLHRHLRPAGQSFKVLGCQVDNPRMLQPARRGNHNILRNVNIPVIAVERVAIKAFDGRLATKNGPSQRMVAPEVADERLVHQVLRVIHLHLQLFQNDALLLLNFFRLKQRVQHQVGKYVERQRQVIVQHLGVVAYQLF